jgi:peptidyl-dipeptidase Dcp
MAQKAASQTSRRRVGAKPARRKKAAERVQRPAAAGNPLLEAWTGPFELPPFARLRSEHFLPAFDRALAHNLTELAAIADQRAQPTFANTIEALERSGRTLDRVASVFFNLSGTDTSPEIEEIERKIAPRLAKHNMRIYQDAKLFKRVAALMRQAAGVELSEEQRRVLERYHRAFVRAGAQLQAGARRRLAAIAACRANTPSRWRAPA